MDLIELFIQTQDPHHYVEGKANLFVNWIKEHLEL